MLGCLERVTYRMMMGFFGACDIQNDVGLFGACDIHAGDEKWRQNFSSECLKGGDLFEASYVSLSIILKRIFKTGLHYFS